MNVLVMGAKGVMGRRYSSILKYLGHVVLPVDIGDPMPDDHWTHAIVATPTDTHYSVLYKLMTETISKRILIEKPVDKSIEAVHELFECADSLNHDLHCVNQYAHLPEVVRFANSNGPTKYDYWNTGKDGLAWDCFQLFGVANSGVVLNDRSPIWDCEINGIKIDHRGMDLAYITMVDAFVTNRAYLLWGKEAVIKITERILAYQ